MPADRLLQTVSTRAPGGFERIEEVLSTAELAAFDQAYRSTTLPDVAALNSRPSLTVTSRWGLPAAEGYQRWVVAYEWRRMASVSSGGS
jgi:tetrahydromethanopterin S-methyltransferase subunit H